MPLFGTAKIEGNNIVYSPSMIPGTDGKSGPEFTKLASNILFDNGEISFKVKFQKPISTCFLVLNDVIGLDSVHVGLQSQMGRGFLFLASKFKNQEKQWVHLEGKGDNRNIKTDTDYEIRLIVKGSKILFTVDDIQMLSFIETISKAPLELLIVGEGEIIVSNFRVSQQKPIAFVVMQFSDEYNQLYDEVIKPTCEAKGFECVRATDRYTTNPIIQDIIESIQGSSVIIANITPDNPNVFYEVGFAHAIKKPTILLCDRKRDKLPFDLSGFRTLFYDNTIAGKSNIERDLNKYLENLFG